MFSISIKSKGDAMPHTHLIEFEDFLVNTESEIVSTQSIIKSIKSNSHINIH